MRCLTTATAVQVPVDGPLTDLLASRPLLLVGIAILTLMIIVGAVLRWRFKRKGEGTSGGKGVSKPFIGGTDSPARPIAHSQSPPPSGTPYLQSLGCSAGTLYYPLTEAVTKVGSQKDNHIYVDESFNGWQSISKNHAQIERDGADLVLVDLNSESGVYINEQRAGVNLLQDDDTVRLGQVQFAFRLNQGGASK